MTAFKTTAVTVLEIDLDRCANTYGVSPCTASGGPGAECYNTWSSCQDKPNFVKTTKTWRFCTGGAPQPVGEQLRPYIADVSSSPTEIDMESGLARRAAVNVVMRDEPDSDVEADPYIANRAAPAQGTFWSRLIARNRNYSGRFARIRRAYLGGTWDWGDFTDELYIVDSIKGPAANGRVEIALKDPVKLADRRKVPEPSTGKLAAELAATDLSLTLEPGQGADYPASGHVRVGDEVIAYDANAGDVLSWPGLGNRAQFGTAAVEAGIGETVQVCQVWIGVTATTVLSDLLLAGDIPPANIDTAGFAAEDAFWLGTGYRITVCLSEPETAATLVADLAVQLGGYLWWDPVGQTVRFRVLAPLRPSQAVAATLRDASEVIEGSGRVETLDGLRTTVRGMLYAIASATADRDEAVNYLRAQLYVDAEAESANEYGDRRTHLLKSRWFGAANDGAVLAQVSRAAAYYRDAPRKLDLAVDAKDAGLREGDIVDLETAMLAGLDGAAKTTRCIVVWRRDERGRVALRLRSTRPGDRRHAFIAPNGTADYPTDTVYAHMAPTAAGFADTGEPYRII